MRPSSGKSAVTWFRLVLLALTTICVCCQPGDELWSKFVSNDLPEHDCTKGPGPWASLKYPNRWYACTQVEGKNIYSHELACSRGKTVSDVCYNISSSQCNSPDEVGSCTGRFFSKDLVRNCDLRKSRGPFVHPTDPTRQFTCKPLAGASNLEWEFDYEERCLDGIASGAQNKCCSPVSKCLLQNADLYNQSKVKPFRASPPFPDIPDGYTLWDDMLVPKDIKQGSLVRNAVPNSYRRWPTGKIPYFIDESLDRIRPDIEAAMADFHNKTCIRFFPWSPGYPEYIYLFLGDGCYSFVGLQHTRGQQLSLNPSCRPSVGVIIHELSHAVGFYHEHTRSDRDEYLEVRWENISPGQESNWDKLPNFGNILFDNFTTDTVMIYSSLSGSKDGLSPTMLDKSGKELPNIELRNSMTTTDASRMNTLYQCAEMPRPTDYHI